MTEIFTYSDEGISSNGGTKNYDPVPPGDYMLEVMAVDPRTTSNGDPMINVEFEIRGGDHDGRKVWNNITFFRDRQNKGAGIALHFLNCIGEPHEGQFKVDIMNWVGKRTKAKLDIDEYQGKRRNKVRWFITDLPSGPLQRPKPAVVSDDVDEDVPF